MNESEHSEQNVCPTVRADADAGSAVYAILRSEQRSGGRDGQVLDQLQAARNRGRRERPAGRAQVVAAVGEVGGPRGRSSQPQRQRHDRVNSLERDVCSGLTGLSILQRSGERDFLFIAAYIKFLLSY